MSQRLRTRQAKRARTTTNAPPPIATPSQPSSITIQTKNARFTIRAWLTGVDGFLDAVEEARQSLSPTVADVLRGALAARTRDGRPDHATRLRAAALLLRNPSADAPPANDAVLPERAVLAYPAALELAAETDDADR